MQTKHTTAEAMTAKDLRIKKSAKLAVKWKLSQLKGENLRLQFEERAFRKNGGWNNEIQAENYGKKLLVRGFISFLKDLQNNSDL